MPRPKPYDHQKIEKKWQKYWAAKKLYRTEELPSKRKCYVLDMFPYPSGEGLHVGHPKGYIGTDIYARFKKMSGFNVLHPMGWDAFGLPAENYAIKNKIHPELAVKKNIKRYKEQLSMIGFNYDWSREINTTDPEYYKWTQWIFLKLFDHGLAYQSFEPINWCPSCQTGLANEDLETRLTSSGEVSVCERCGSVVEKRPMRQWVLKITDYADRLLKDLDDLAWPESIKESQRNWIGRSEGAQIKFEIPNIKKQIEVFTTRPDTLFGATYVVLAPEHPFVQEEISSTKSQITNKAEIKKYIDKIKNSSEIERTAEGKEKTGVRLEGIIAINPANGEELPVFIADYVLASYGTGAVMAVPAHDDRDWEFAKKFDLPIRQVVMPSLIDHSNPPREGKENTFRNIILAIVYDPKRDKYLTLKWKTQPWTSFVTGGVEDGEDRIQSAQREITEETGYRNIHFVESFGLTEAHFFAAHKDVNRRTHAEHFLFELVDDSRVSVADNEKAIHEIQWLTFKELLSTPLQHAEADILRESLKSRKHIYLDKGIMCNSAQFNGHDSETAKKEITKFVKGKWLSQYRLKDWVFSRQRYWGEPIPVIHCEQCGVIPVPEKDLPVKLPKVKSYAPTGTGESPLADIKSWVNTKCPQCKGSAKRETNTMPQWAGSSWYYLRYLDPKNKKSLVDPKKEKYWMPVDMYVGGTEHATRHLIYARFWHKFLYDLGVVSTLEPFSQLKNQGLIAGPDGRKMSKRFGNVINPDDVVRSYGADSFRVYEMFMGPFDQGNAWNTDNMMGARRFVEKIWRLQSKVLPAKNAVIDHTLETLVNQTIKKVTSDIDRFSFNTAISAMMVLANELEKHSTISAALYEPLLKLLAPFAPHVTDELWQALGHKKSIHLEPWAEYDEAKTQADEITLVVQVGGKVRTSLKVPAGLAEAEALKLALADHMVQKWVGDKSPQKVIYVKNRLINIVI